MDSDDIREHATAIVGELDTKYQAREHALSLSRKIIHAAAEAIQAMHRDDFEQAMQVLKDASDMLRTLTGELEEHQDLYHSGFVYDAQQEYAEATIVKSILLGSNIPSPAEISVEFVPYLNALCDVTGELRRKVVDLLRNGDVERADKMFEIMENIYGELMRFDYPDAMMHGLRRRRDALRSLLERTRGDIMTARRQLELEDSIRQLEEKL